MRTLARLGIKLGIYELFQDVFNGQLFVSCVKPSSTFTRVFACWYLILIANAQLRAKSCSFYIAIKMFCRHMNITTVSYNNNISQTVKIHVAESVSEIRCEPKKVRQATKQWD